MTAIERHFAWAGAQGRGCPGIFTPTPYLDQVEPAEPLPVGAPDFESAVTALHEQIFVPNDYRVTALSRAPYLCSGSAGEPVEVLDDVILVLAR